MISKSDLVFLPFLAAPLTLLTAGGCSGDPAVAVSGADQPFSDEELAAMRKSAKTGREFRDLVRLKTMERAGSTVVKTKSIADEPRSHP
jgi:hypothetical protein